MAGTTFLKAYAWLSVALYLPFTNRRILDLLRWPLFCLIVIWYLTASRRQTAGEAYPKTFFGIFSTLAFWLCASTLWSPEPFYTLQRAVSLSFLGAFLFTVAQMIGTRTLSCRAVGFGLVSWLTAIIVPGILLWVVGLQRVPILGLKVYDGSRFAGIVKDCNQLGVCAGVCVPIVLAFALADRRRKRRWWALLGATVLSVLLSGSRGGVLSTTVGCLVFWANLKGKLTAGVLLAILVGPVMLLVTADQTISDAILRYFRRDYGETLEEISDNRLRRWRAGWYSIRKRPWFGQGYGIGGVERFSDPRFTNYDRGYPLHNSYLQMWQESGVVGLALLLALLAPIFLNVLLSPLPRAPDFPIACGFAGALVGGMVSACFESWLFSVGNLATLPFWLVAAVVAALRVTSCPSHRAQQSSLRFARGAPEQLR